MRLISLCGALCIFYLVQDARGQSTLNNPCKHNEFRCSGGSKCITTEKLCNGKKDCPKGEDERGSTQWDCSKITLSTQCDPEKEIKCRYGGCVKREKLCDGKPDCWGANDEAIEVCEGRRPQVAPNVRPSQTPSQRPPSTQTQPAAPVPRPPSRPQSRPTQAVPQPASPASSQPGDCPPIREDSSFGFDVRCTNAYNKPLDCTAGPLPNGAIATYRCKKYFSPPRTGSSSTTRTCGNGQWSPKRQSFYCNLECGLGGNENVALITGGISSKRGKWPWHVALYHEDPPNSGKIVFFCGGSLISDKAVLTAAHCASKPSTTQARDPRDIKVVVGKFLRSYRSREGTEQERAVRKIAVNEDYNSYSLENDIAILWLDKKVEITDHVRPVCLPQENADVEPGSDYGQLVGWGRTSNGKFLEDLQEAKIPVVNSKTCKAAHQTFNSLVRSTTFCAGYLNGTSACDGDSGGGLVFPDQDNSKTWLVQGIVSAGIAKRLGQGGGCQEQYYAVFTRVARYRNWIEGKLDANYFPNK